MRKLSVLVVAAGLFLSLPLPPTRISMSYILTA